MQNSKLVKALQDSGLAAETGPDRVGVFGLENVRATPSAVISFLACPHRWLQYLFSADLSPCNPRWVQYGNTCYCNSVLQALYFCKPFRQRVSGYRPAWLADGEQVR